MAAGDADEEDGGGFVFAISRGGRESRLRSLAPRRQEGRQWPSKRGVAALVGSQRGVEPNFGWNRWIQNCIGCDRAGPVLHKSWWVVSHDEPGGPHRSAGEPKEKWYTPKQPAFFTLKRSTV
jgi:hypothetical protein